MKIIDGLDIGWGGVQRWATARMPEVVGLHLDFACGYGTFIAQLGWRFPDIQLVGLNIDYAGPHACITSLLDEAGVNATLVQSDAQCMPFKDETFGSVSCFLGLQDIGIGFGDPGVVRSVHEALRVLQQRGVMVLIDEFPFSDLCRVLNGLPVTEIERAERQLDIHWERDIAERAITLYAEGWIAQHRGQPWRWAMQLGDWRLALGDRTAALAAYRQALEWSPGEAAVRERVERFR